MKYIRTNKNKIYECVSEDENGYDCDTRRLPLKHALTKVAKQKSYYGVEYALKQADTIEELCDEFVIIDEENEHYIKQDNDIHHIRRKMVVGNYKCYGAVWTDKGLIYVAKMNEKGVLELL